MKKDIEWLKKEIGTEMIQLEPNRAEKWSDVKYQALRSVAQKLDQLDEPEVTLNRTFDKKIEWLVKTINTERASLRQRFESGKETADESAFNDGRDWALLLVLKLIERLD